MNTDRIKRNQSKIRDLPTQDKDDLHMQLTYLDTDDERVRTVELEMLKEDGYSHLTVYVDKDNIPNDLDISAGDEPQNPRPLTTLTDALGVEGIHSELVHTLPPLFTIPKRTIARQLLENNECSFSGWGDPDIDFVGFTFPLEIPVPTNA